MEIPTETLVFLAIGLVLFVVTLIALGRAIGASSAPRRAQRQSRARRDEAAEGRTATGGAAPGAPAKADEEISAGAPASEREAAATRQGGAVLPWLTFAVSLFGTVSTFVLSLLTYLNSLKPPPA